MPRTERTVYGPDQEMLTDEQAASFLGIHGAMFRRLVKKRLLPQGVPFGPKTVRWPWMDLVAVAHLIARGFIVLPQDDSD